MPGNTLFSIGEALIDMIPSRVGCTFDEVPSFSPRTGGAPANVCAAFARLGGASSFLTQLGDDPFGHKIARELEACGIDLSHLVFTDKANTALAFVSLEEDGNRTFSFYRKPSADLLYAPEQIDLAWFRDAFALHFCSVSLVDSPMRHAHLAAIGAAREAGAIVSFDPNLRPPLWKSLDEAKAEIEYGLSKCDILKISDNEIQWLTGKNDYTEAVKRIREKYDIPLILVSMGKEGSRAYYQDRMVEKAPFINENTIETTGAGDTFCACVLHYICKHGLENLTEKNLKEMLTYANAAASIITTRKGALRVMPRPEEIEALIAGHH